MSHVVVVGAGISGLSAAYYLRRGAPKAHITVLEASDRLGGILRTVREDGFVVEAGPDSFLASKPAGLQLCRDLGIEGRLIGTVEANRGSFVLHGGRLHPIPEGLTGLVPSRLEPLLASDLFSPAGKERLAAEPAMPPSGDAEDESLKAFVERRFGAEVYERLIEPLMAGIYAGDGSRLSILATFPQLRAMEREHGSILRAMASRGPAPSTSAPTGFVSPQGGMQEIIEAMVRSLADVDVHRGEPVRAVERAGKGWNVSTEPGRSYRADAAILALPAAATGHVVGELSAELGEALASIPSASSATVSFAFRQTDVGHPLKGYGYIIPRAANRPALACTWVSSKWPERVAPGFVLLRVFLGRYGQDETLDRSDDGLAAIAREELRVTLGITASPQRQWLFRWPRVMPQYLVGHGGTVRRITSALAQLPGLYAAGNAYAGVGVPDCIRGGHEAARAAVAHVAGRPMGMQ
jgi:oxygen-dependent protoporphyrinogen oxidase